MKTLLAVLVVLTMASLASAQIHTPPEIIFINGDIYPGVIRIITRSGTNSYYGTLVEPRVQAMAVTGEKIVAIGSNADIQKLKGPKTQVIDLGGHFVMPGFNDAHTHLASGGFEKLDIDLVGTKSLDEMKQRIAARAKTAGPGEWLIGRGRALELALQDAAQWGLTSAQDNSEWEDFLVYEQMAQEGKLTLRISEWLPFDASLDQLNHFRSHHRVDDTMLRTTMLKGFMDGSLGSRTAAMLAPYTDDPKNSGI